MWENPQYCWVVFCKNWFYHVRKNIFHRHRIPLAVTDGVSPRPVIGARFLVRCDDCGKEYLYDSTEVLRYEQEPTESFQPHPLFREEDEGSVSLSGSLEGATVQDERRRTPRYPFIATARIVGPSSSARVGKVKDLSDGGSYVALPNPFSSGADVFLTISTEFAVFHCKARVIHSTHGIGMGLNFGEISPRYHLVLTEWLNEAKSLSG